MTKDRTSITLDPEIMKQVKEDDSTNLSALINEWLQEYYDVNRDTQKTLLRQRRDELERRIEYKKNEIEMLEGEIEELREERDQLDEELGEVGMNRDEVVKEAEKVLPSTRDPDNPAVRNWARKAGMSPEEFVEMLGNGV